MSSQRRATHSGSGSGSWYTNSGPDLSRQLEKWLNDAELSYGPARAIIAPHAGYSYCGENGGYAYRQVSPAVVKRIFILGPCHHVRISTCALSNFTTMKTPLYDLKVDTEINKELAKNGFTFSSKDADEDEHSIEMHLPYIAKIMEDFKDQFTIVPIMVGGLTPEKEAFYGEKLAEHLANPQHLFVISSDFCHWGERFRYTNYDASYGPIYKSIEHLDKQAMDLIESLNPKDFTKYLKHSGNTICGRHPIGVLLQAVNVLRTRNYNMSLKFLKYDQSSKCRDFSDSSVSYASASLIFE